MSMAQGHADFAARINRIEKRGTGTRAGARAQVNRLEEYAYQSAGVARKKPARGGRFIAMMLAVVMGFISLVLAQLGVFHAGWEPDLFKSQYSPVPLGQADLEWINMGLIALIFALTVGFMLRMRFFASLVPLTLGIVLGLSSMHNLVHMAPEPFAKAFSPAWVSHTVNTTEPVSIRFRGVSYNI